MNNPFIWNHSGLFILFVYYMIHSYFLGPLQGMSGKLSRVQKSYFSNHIQKNYLFSRFIEHTSIFLGNYLDIRNIKKFLASLCSCVSTSLPSSIGTALENFECLSIENNHFQKNFGFFTKKLLQNYKNAAYESNANQQTLNSPSLQYTVYNSRRTNDNIFIGTNVFKRSNSVFCSYLRYPFPTLFSCALFR